MTSTASAVFGALTTARDLVGYLQAPRQPGDLKAAQQCAGLLVATLEDLLDPDTLIEGAGSSRPTPPHDCSICRREDCTSDHACE